MYSLVILRGSSYNPDMEILDQKSREGITIAGLLASGNDIAIHVTRDPTRGEIVKSCEDVLKVVDTVEAGRLLAHMLLVSTVGPMGAGNWLQHWYVVTEHIEPLREFRELLEIKGLVDPIPGRQDNERITVVVSRALARDLRRNHDMKAEDLIRDLLRAGSVGGDVRAA